MLSIINLARIFTSFFETTELAEGEQKNMIVNSDGNKETELNLKEAVDYGCIAADFPDDMLSLEIMKLGHDPANLNRKKMIEMLYKKMEEHKPVSEILEIRNAENN